MESKVFIFVALVLLCSVFAEKKSGYVANEAAQNEIKGDEPKQINTFFGKGYGGMGGGGGEAPAVEAPPTGEAPAGGAPPSGEAAPAGAGSYSAGFSHGGIYGGGDICKFGCCSESYGYSHLGGGYYSCKCCATAAEAEAFKQSQAKAEIKN